jgi:hypothetical protein
VPLPGWRRIPHRQLAWRPQPAVVTPPVTLAWTAEGGTDQTDVTVANSGGASGDAWQTVQTGTGAIKRYSVAHDHSGSLGIEFATGATATTPTVGWNTNIGIQTEVWFRQYIYFTANPALEPRILHIHDAAGSTQRCSVSVRPDGLLQMLNSVGSTAVGDRTTIAIALNAWNRVEFHAILSATVGQYEVKLFKTDPEATVITGPPDNELVSSAATQNLGGAGGTYRFGISGTPLANVASWWSDDMSVSTVGWIGPTAAAAPTGPPAPFVSQYSGRW